MAVCRIIEPPVTAQQYDQVRERLEAQNSMPPEGMQIHIAGQSEDGWRIVELWDSRGAADQWAQKVGQAIGELGFEGGPPKVTYFDVHKVERATA